MKPLLQDKQWSVGKINSFELLHALLRACSTQASLHDLHYIYKIHRKHLVAEE